MTCDQCGADNLPEARFCSSCGRPMQAPSEERRVATVLFADVVGFTSLAERRDPEDVKHLLDRLFERLVRVVHDHGGQVDKIVGDAVVALFGAPVAHEDDAERAVRAALRMQETAAEYAAEVSVPVELRIGLNTGEVLTGALRSGGDYTAMGDVMNTASRVQTSADPGEVRVASATYRATHQVIGYTPIGPLQARGREEPVEVWAATAPILPPGYRPRRRRTPLVGRGAELDLLLTTARLSVRHGRAQVLVLIGEAGVGKQRLANELTDVMSVEDDVLVLAGRCVPYGEANPFWPLAEALRSGFGIGREDPLDSARTRLRAAVDAVAAGAGRTRPEVVVDGLVHLMGYDGPLRALDGARARTEATQALLTLLEATLAVRPVMLRLADLHWADESVLDVLDALTEQLARQPLVVVATARRMLQTRWAPRPGRHNVVVLNLDPLGRESAERLLTSIAGDDLDPTTRADLLDRAGGNPFYLEELVTLLGQRGPSADGTGELPDTLRGLVAARIDGLGPEEQAVLEDAAVWGPSGERTALERMGEAVRGNGDVAATLQLLADKDVLVVDGSRWAFRSDVVREVAYARLTRRDRLVRHTGIAEHLEAWGAQEAVPDSLVLATARHFTEAARLAADLGDPSGHEGLRDRAVRWVLEAGQVAIEAANWHLADQVITQALDLLGRAGGAERLTLLLDRSLVRAEQWDFVGARADAEAALSLAEVLGEPDARARALLRLGQAHMRSGEWGAADEALAQALESFDAAGDVTGRAETMRQSGMAHLLRGDHVGAAAPIAGALDAFVATSDRRGEAWALQNLAWISFVEGRAADAEAQALASEQAFTEVGDQGGLAWTRGLLAFVRLGQGDFAAARALSAEVLRESERRGDGFGRGMMQLVQAGVELWTGHPRAAADLITTAITGFRTVGDPFGLEQALALEGRALVMAGGVSRGLEVLAEAGRVSTGTSTTFAESVLILTEVQLGRPARLVEAGPPGAAEVQLDGTISATQPVAAWALAMAQAGRADEVVDQLAAAVPDGSGHAYEQSALAMVAAACGRVDRTRTAVDQVLDDVRATYLDRVTALLAAALVDLGDEGDAALARARVEVGGTEDAVAAALTSLAAAVRAEATGSSPGQDRTDAEQRLGDLGLAGTGWRTLFADAAGAAAVSGRAGGRGAGRPGPRPTS